MPETDCGPGSPIADAHPCPMCDYLLVGLPKKHRCPECGFLFDPHARVIELGAKSRFQQGLALGAALLLLMVFGGSCEWEFGDYVLLAVIAGSAFLVFIKITSGDYLQRLILNSEGVQFVRGEHCRITIDWAHVDEARCSRLLGKLTIMGRDGSRVFRCPVDELGGWRIGERCAQAINGLREVYCDA